MAERTLKNFQRQLQQAPEALPIMLAAQQELLEAPSFIVIAGRRQDAETRKLLEIVHRSWIPQGVLFCWPMVEKTKIF